MRRAWRRRSPRALASSGLPPSGRGPPLTAPGGPKCTGSLRPRRSGWPPPSGFSTAALYTSPPFSPPSLRSCTSDLLHDTPRRVQEGVRSTVARSLSRSRPHMCCARGPLFTCKRARVHGTAQPLSTIQRSKDEGMAVGWLAAECCMWSALGGHKGASQYSSRPGWLLLCTCVVAACMGAQSPYQAEIHHSDLSWYRSHRTKGSCPERTVSHASTRDALDVDPCPRPSFFMSLLKLSRSVSLCQALFFGLWHKVFSNFDEAAQPKRKFGAVPEESRKSSKFPTTTTTSYQGSGSSTISY
mmetsp:Transcript_8483/g.27927  ORF Transcript_8483/g.27927 Transcript_8483/m.27927 type:complete len:299 (-) Transcript_8483:27-923(-)